MYKIEKARIKIQFFWIFLQKGIDKREKGVYNSRINTDSDSEKKKEKRKKWKKLFRLYSRS